MQSRCRPCRSTDEYTHLWTPLPHVFSKQCPSSKYTGTTGLERATPIITVAVPAISGLDRGTAIGCVVLCLLECMQQRQGFGSGRLVARG